MQSKKLIIITEEGHDSTKKPNKYESDYTSESGNESSTPHILNLSETEYRKILEGAVQTRYLRSVGEGNKYTRQCKTRLRRSSIGGDKEGKNIKASGPRAIYKFTPLTKIKRSNTI